MDQETPFRSLQCVARHCHLVTYDDLRGRNYLEIFGHYWGQEVTATASARQRMRHLSQSKNFIFFAHFQHLAEIHLISSDMGHLKPVTITVAGFRTFALIGEYVHISIG